MMSTLLEQIQTGEELYELSFDGLTLPTAYGRLLATGCSFRKVGFSKSKLLLDCTDTVFTGCDFSFCKLSGSSLLRCKFIGCDFTGADLCESFWRDCSFTDCKCDMVNCNQSKYSGVVYQNCRMESAYFENCTLKKTSFQGCRLSGGCFHGTKLKEIDLTTCDIDRLKLRQEDLQGCKLTFDQAITFLWMLGIKIL